MFLVKLPGSGFADTQHESKKLANAYIAKLRELKPFIGADGKKEIKPMLSESVVPKIVDISEDVSTKAASLVAAKERRNAARQLLKSVKPESIKNSVLRALYDLLI